QIFEIEGSDLMAVAIFSSFPQMRGVDFHALIDHVIRETELAIKLQRARLHHHCSRLLARTICLRDDAERRPATRQTQRQVEPGGSSANDENIAWGHTFILASTRARLAHRSDNVSSILP